MEASGLHEKRPQEALEAKVKKFGFGTADRGVCKAAVMVQE